jgi:hypothetical protein
VLLTPAAALSSDVSSTISTLGIAQVIAVGGASAFPNALVTALQGLTSPALPVLRVAGATAADTAVQVAGMELATTAKGGLGLNGANTTAIVVTHADAFADGLGADTVAGLAGGATPATNATSIWPIILTDTPTTVSTFTTAALNKMGGVTGFQSVKTIGTIVALGGVLAIPASTLSTLQSALAT